ncbi:MAG: FG-GAP-like repeat-containing protein, partial [bacterium]|nr:FG-GAP-like repeat-containing protein [bacterium]
DLDGDGLLDIAGARYSPNQLITYINDGTGAFPTVTDTEALAASPADLALGNVDTDSDVDAAIPHGASSLSVLLNNGSGVFGTPTDYTVGGSPAAAVMADLDGDTDTDIAVANLGSSNVSILLNNGLGTFTVAGPYAAGASPTSIEAGNLDGDGDIDLVVGDGVGDVTVLINNGSGVFAADPAYPTGGNIEDVVLGLINDDAVLDVVATDTSAEAVYVRFGNGDGTLGSAVMYPMLYFNNAQETALGDYDGDGDIDLATTNASTASSTLVQLNNGSGVFVDPVYYGTGLLGETITSGDFNGDGAIDLAAASGIQDAFMILLNAYSAPEVIVTESGGTTVVTEGGATDSYTVHLASEPHATVTVTATPDAQETVSPSMLTFTTLNYATPQTVTVTAVDDGPGEGQHTGLITHSVASTDLRFDGIAVDSVVPTILEVAAAGPSGVQRISGESPRDLAIQASKETFAAGAADSATLAREDIIVDALTVTPLSNLLHATLLLTSSGGLADEVAAELDRALGGPDSGKPIYLTGGTEALTPQVVTDLEALGYSNIVRLDGQNRRRTAKRVAEEIVTQNPTPTSTAYIAEDSFFADSLGLGAIAASLSNDTVDPILLVERGKPVLEPAAREFLEARPEIVQVELVGGPVAIDLEVEQALKELLPVRATTRHAGADRYATNANLLEAKLSDPQGIVVANGAQSNLPGAEAGSVAAASAGQTNFFSALLAGRFAADQDLGLALTRAAGLPDPIVEWFARHESTLTFAFILGDFSAVSAEVEASILSYL